MTSDDIRNEPIGEGSLLDIAYILREIAAQLAELNENMKISRRMTYVAMDADPR